MTLPVRWTKRALLRLDKIGAHIANHNPEAAGRVVQRLASAASLVDFPLRVERDG
jgi:plasmid stabilization system protein ParE